MKNKHNPARKIFSFFLAFLLIASFSLAGCGNKSATNKTSDGKTKLVMWTFVQQHADYWKDAVKTWNKNHPKEKIDLKVNVLPFDQMNQKLQVALNSGNGAPDIADIEIGQFATYTKSSTVPFVDLTKTVQPYMANLVKSRVDNYTFKGKVYGLDYHVGTTVVYYNMDIMKKAGIDPSTIKTWEDYTKAGQTVKQKTGKYMTSVETAADFVLDAMISQQHSDVIKNGKSAAAQDKNIKALQMLHDWVYKYGIAKKAESGNQDNEEYFGAFNKGNYASVIMPEWYMSRMVTYMKNLSGKIDIEPLPVFNSGDNRSAGLGGTSTVVTNQATDKALAKKFVVESKASKEGAIKQWTILGFDPIRSDVWTAPEMKADNQYTKYFGKDIFDKISALKNEIGGMSFTSSAYPTVNDQLLTNTIPNVMKNKVSVKKALEDADKAANKKLTSK
ncbi:ABC transporter substrate-binding protein [Heyndrickxia coagulans]|uniref:ABC transporter substrate-binding protein n=1 Tax=Heyndrickxia coagulans TaxID=1398 RepID=UPI0008F820BA|nr:ABC transporter substrate-binding protein [Heyndrickxia coagulans]APB36850.1 hypothetical protein BIZ35_08470 [Heyndrickxia coagulans]QPG52653.1 carbohydrate ABC transporter substrate-binding protein [Heyndrickxia coagulans]WNE60674.1 carbohydrate ABC transporter substrate-binding protein [Heyndrickxia coagulans]